MESDQIKMPKTLRGMQTLNKIVRAAERVIGKKGYHNTSINDIATRAKVAPGTLYIYFPDKLSLYCYLLNQYSHMIRQSIAKRCEGLTDRREIERMGMLAYLEYIRKKPYIYNIIWESLFIDKQLFESYYETFGSRYAKNVSHAQKEGSMTEGDPIMMAYILMGISNFIGLKYVMFDKDSDLEPVVDEVMRLLDKGFFNRD